jgi:cell division protein FtsB
VRARRLTDAIILTIILAAAATCFSAYSRSSAELNGVLKKHDAAAEKVRDLAIKVEKLERDVEQLRTDSRVIEQFARQRFGFVRSGEVVIKLPQETRSEASTTSTGGLVRVSTSPPRPSDGYTDASN